MLTGPLPPVVDLGKAVLGALYLCDLSPSESSTIVRFAGLEAVRDSIKIEGTAAPVRLEFPDLVDFGSLEHAPQFPGYLGPDGDAGRRLIGLPRYASASTTSARNALISVDSATLELPLPTYLHAVGVTGPQGTLRAPRLDEVGDLSLTGTSFEPVAAPVGHPELRKAGGLSVHFWPEATEVRFERLAEVERLSITGSTKLTQLSFPALRAITSQITVRGNPRLSGCELRRLLEQLEMPLPVVDTDLAFENLECP